MFLLLHWWNNIVICQKKNLIIHLRENHSKQKICIMLDRNEIDEIQ